MYPGQRTPSTSRIPTEYPSLTGSLLGNNVTDGRQVIGFRDPYARASYSRRYSTSMPNALMTAGDSEGATEKPSEIIVIFNNASLEEAPKKSLKFFHGICFFLAGVTTYNWFYIVLAAGSDWIGVASSGNSTDADGHFTQSDRHWTPLCHEKSASFALITYMIPVFVGKLVAMVTLNISILIRIIGVAVIGIIGGMLIALSRNIYASAVGVGLAGFYCGFCEATFISLSSLFLKSATAWFTFGMGVICVVIACLYVVFQDFVHEPFIFLQINAAFPVVMLIAFALMYRDFPERAASRGLNFKQRTADLVQHYRNYLSLSLLVMLSFIIHQGLFQILAYTQLDFLSAHQQYHLFDAMFFVGYTASMLSVKIFRLTLTWLLAALQVINIIILTADGVLHYIKSIWIIFFMVFYAGFLFGGGLVGAIYELYTTVDPVAREFGLAAVSAWSEIGVLLGALLGVALHNMICSTVRK
ncbi:unnamed protein product [Notodromas monacha]|uniref:Battenin n=1 Tax=Notodromas monacha TaxID=399045 RepID=A0A7R9BEZ3_9CRUS|nr:unnamed protein product [Notodromas monacha]CAG0913588.1 unnamed protein product [Notodromas monacha]